MWFVVTRTARGSADRPAAADDRTDRSRATQDIDLRAIPAVEDDAADQIADLVFTADDGHDSGTTTARIRSLRPLGAASLFDSWRQYQGLIVRPRLRWSPWSFTNGSRKWCLRQRSSTGQSVRPRSGRAVDL